MNSMACFVVCGGVLYVYLFQSNSTQRLQFLCACNITDLLVCRLVVIHHMLSLIM